MHDIAKLDWGLKSGGGLFTLPCGKVLNFPSPDLALIGGWGVPARSAGSFSRRCIDGTTPDDIGPGRNLGIDGPGGKCGSVSQEQVQWWLCKAGGLRGAGAGTLRAARGLLQARPLCQAGCGNVLRAQGQAVLQDQLAEVLPQEVCAPDPGLLRGGHPGRLSHPPGFGSALSPVPLVYPPNLTSACTLHAPA